MVTIKDLHELAQQYSRENYRNKYSDLYTYGCFIDLLNDYRVNAVGDTQDGDYKLSNNDLTINDVWKDYIESDTGFDLTYGFDSAYDAISEYFRDKYTEEITEDVCEICEENPKATPEGKYCESCRDEYKESN